MNLPPLVLTRCATDLLLCRHCIHSFGSCFHKELSMHAETLSAGSKDLHSQHYLMQNVCQQLSGLQVQRTKDQCCCGAIAYEALYQPAVVRLGLLQILQWAQAAPGGDPTAHFLVCCIEKLSASS